VSVHKAGRVNSRSVNHLHGGLHTQFACFCYFSPTKDLTPFRAPIVVICKGLFSRYFWRLFLRFLVPRYLQYPPTPLSLLPCVCVYPCQMLSHSETFHHVLMSACQGNGKGQAGDGGSRRGRPGGYNAC